jgi:drug/metabolite transporter (DMT)-like permease
VSSEPLASLRRLPAGARGAFASAALRGIALMFVSTFFFAAMHDSIRYMSATIHPFEIVLFRNVFALVVMPFDFFKLVWVTLIAWLAFAENPDLYTWIGGAVIFASALYIAYRERAAPTRT